MSADIEVLARLNALGRILVNEGRWNNTVVTERARLAPAAEPTQHTEQCKQLNHADLICWGECTEDTPSITVNDLMGRASPGDHEERMSVRKAQSLIDAHDELTKKNLRLTYMVEYLAGALAASDAGEMHNATELIARARRKYTEAQEKAL